MPNVKITGQLEPTSALDTYATHSEQYGAGGYRSEDTILARNAIPADRRKAGMLVYVKADATVYKLGANLIDWTLFFVAGSSVTHRFNAFGDGRVTVSQPRRVITVGDSLSYNTYTGELQTLLRTLDPNWVVDYRGVGGDTVTMIRERMMGGLYNGPVRGADQLVVGVNTIRARPYNPPLNDNDADSDYQIALRRNGTPNPDRMVLFNRGTYVDGMTKLDFYARCGGANQLTLYSEVTNTDNIPDAGNEDAVMTAGTLGLTSMTQSADVGSSEGYGAYSAKCVADAATGFHGVYVSASADCIYDIECWVYIPTVGGVPSLSITYDGVGSEHLSTTSATTTAAKGVWTKLQSRAYLGPGATVASVNYSHATPAPGAVFYVDGWRVKKTHIKVPDHKLKANDNVWLEACTTATVPVGLRVNRNYYIQLVGGSTNTVELLMASAGVQDTYAGTGWAIMHAGWSTDYTYAATGAVIDDTKYFDFSVEPDNDDMGAVWIIWAGSNNNYTQAEMVKDETKRIISLCRTGRVIMLTPVGSNLHELGSPQRDWLLAHRDWMFSRWPNNTIDITSLLIANNDGSVQDKADCGNGIHPLSLRDDLVHLNAAGYSLVANAVYAKMITLGYV
jgi:hypothetical protein